MLVRSVLANRLFQINLFQFIIESLQVPKTTVFKRCMHSNTVMLIAYMVISSSNSEFDKGVFRSPIASVNQLNFSPRIFDFTACPIFILLRLLNLLAFFASAKVFLLFGCLHFVISLIRLVGAWKFQF